MDAGVRLAAALGPYPSARPAALGLHPRGRAARGRRPGGGGSATGCAGRIRVRLALESVTGGPALYVRVFLHSAEQRACLFAQTGPLVLPAGRAADVEVVLDQSDECRTPVDIRTMAAVVEGTVEVASRQEWRIVYTLSP
jgi:hypothetical protein